MEKVENERLAVLETEVKNIKGVVDRIDKKLDGLSNGFVTKDDFKDVELRLSALEKKRPVRDVLLWVGLAVSLVSNIILAYQAFRGM